MIGKKGVKLLIVILGILIILAGVLLAMKVVNTKNEEGESKGIISLGTEQRKSQ